MINNSWESKRYNRYKFPVVVNTDMQNIAYVHPLKQKVVAELYDTFKCTNVKLILFGSSINMRCTVFSDLDIAVYIEDTSVERMAEVSEKIQLLTDWDADIIWLHTLNRTDRLADEIRMGVDIL